MMFVQFSIFCLFFIQQTFSQCETNKNDLIDFQGQLKLFTKYYVEFNKSYNSIEEFSERFKYFQDSLATIAELNANEYDTAVYEINKFADYSPEERKRLSGFQVSSLEDIDFAEIPDIELPESFDWRFYNAVTPVKDQGGCNCCWAFSAVGNIEGQFAIKHKVLLSFSEQELLSCSGIPCSQGWYMINAYELVRNLGGIETEQQYPYVSGSGVDYPCQFDKNKVWGQVTGFSQLSPNEDDMAKWLVQNGPISVAVDDSWMIFYKNGVYRPSNNSCSSGINHGVLIVGFGVDGGTQYWIIKNSWGKEVGMNGYYYLERGVGACSVNTYATTATVA